MNLLCRGIADWCKKNGAILEEDYPIICPEQEVQDIDTEEDWKMAELKAEYLKKHKEEGS